MSDENQIIYQDEDRVLDAHIKKSDGSCYDITGNTAVATFEGTSGNVVVSTVAIGNAGGGEWLITLTDAQTALLKKGNTSFELVMTDGSGLKRTVQFINSLTVTPSLF